MQLISQTILDWHTDFGRSDLPWQGTHDAYRIWVSEIMLQQTQVNTVIPYYLRFIQHYPTVTALADADIDQVLHLWTGLGYYARARNLHTAAAIIRDQYRGRFPENFAEVLALPGIGRSTAGAILAFSQGQRHAILDGNVKRVLARFYEVEGWYGQKTVENRLWELAEQNTPQQELARYTQAIMDFGATLCTRAKPQCAVCPLQSNCQAYTSARVSELPHGKPKTAKPTKQTFMLLIRNQDGAYLLEQKPPSGIWGGLWCPPQADTLDRQMQVGNLVVETGEHLATIKHSFSHFHLLIKPVEAHISDQLEKVTEQQPHLWYKSRSQQHLQQRIGLAAPVKKLLERYQ